MALWQPIHMPMKGVIGAVAVEQRVHLVSTHTPARGVTASVAPLVITALFLSTHPRKDATVSIIR